MALLIPAEEVTLDTLISHVEAAGLSPVRVDEKQFRLRTLTGIAFWAAIEDDRQFIRLHTYLPTSKAKTRQEKLEFAHQLSAEIFLPVFSLDGDADVLMNYVFPYGHALVAEQFVALVHRFASLLEYLVQSFDRDGMFNFGPSAIATDACTNGDTLEAPLVTDGPPLLH
jgi:hypothetical protein